MDLYQKCPNCFNDFEEDKAGCLCTNCNRLYFPCQKCTNRYCSFFGIVGSKKIEDADVIVTTDERIKSIVDISSYEDDTSMYVSLKDIKDIFSHILVNDCCYIWFCQECLYYQFSDS